MTTTYKEYKDAKQEEFNALPLFWAFSEEQLKEQLEKRGYKLEDAKEVLYRYPMGGFYLKKDKQIIIDYHKGVEGRAQELHDMLENDPEFARDAFEYEMYDHEYPINWQGDWDVVSCFGNVAYSEEKNGAAYLRELGFSDKVILIYREAARKVCKDDIW